MLYTKKAEQSTRKACFIPRLHAIALKADGCSLETLEVTFYTEFLWILTPRSQHPPATACERKKRYYAADLLNVK